MSEIISSMFLLVVQIGNFADIIVHIDDRTTTSEETSDADRSGST